MTETLAWSTYSDAGALELGQRRIFAAGWQYVGHTGQVERPGDRFSARAGHVPVAVVRDEEGALRAFLNVCRHRGAEVVRESGNRKTLQCHYHQQKEELIAFDAQVGAEDRVLVESVQRGMRAGLVQHGRLLPESERLIAHFQALVRSAL
jgi:nitrite reductase/ring-hydroxylating ferredoxin subunit